MVRPWSPSPARIAPGPRVANSHEEIDQSGKRRQQDVESSTPTVYGMEWDDCALGSLATARDSFQEPDTGSIYYTPGYSNGGWGNFSESSLFGAIGVDGDGDGRADISAFATTDLNGREQFAHLIGPMYRPNLLHGLRRIHVRGRHEPHPVL